MTAAELRKAKKFVSKKLGRGKVFVTNSIFPGGARLFQAVDSTGYIVATGSSMMDLVVKIKRIGCFGLR